MIFHEVKVQRIHPDAKLPVCAHPGEDLCFDVSAVETVRLYPFTPTAVRTGLKFEMPPHTGFSVRPRSGMGSKGVIVLGGEIDNGYRGELMVLLVLVNHSVDGLLINAGDRIAQLRPEYVTTDLFTFTEVDEIDSNTKRGEKGFGSTGK